MDEITMLVTALISGAIAGSKGVATQVVTDCYNSLKKRVFGNQADTTAVETALKQVEDSGDVKIWQPALQDAVRQTDLAADPEVVEVAKNLLALLESEGLTKSTKTGIVTGSGAIAQGSGSIAAGEGGTAIGKVDGDVTIGGKS